MAEHQDERDQPEAEPQPPEDAEAGRDEVAGARGGQPGYDLDEGQVYEDAEGAE